VVDEGYAGLAFEDEGERCARLLADPKDKVMVMGNHGVLVIGDSVADTFNRLFYCERAAEIYIKALWTGVRCARCPTRSPKRWRARWTATPTRPSAISPN
jgi:ribulose-5-phosphate 4-epimerase/fuculose-1-phosphate aldolase